MQFLDTSVYFFNHLGSHIDMYCQKLFTKCFHTVAEYDRLREIYLAKPLRRNMLSLHRVPLSRAIQVHNIGDVTEDTMMLYFENERSGGGHVTSMRFCRDDDYAVLEMQEHSRKLHCSHRVEY